MFADMKPENWDEDEARFQFKQAIWQPSIKEVLQALLFEDTDELAKIRIKIKKARALTQERVDRFMAAEPEQKREIAGSAQYTVPEVTEEEITQEKANMRFLNGNR